MSEQENITSEGDTEPPSENLNVETAQGSASGTDQNNDVLDEVVDITFNSIGTYIFF